MLTRRGWTVVVVALAFVVGGRMFAIVELYVLAAVGLLLCATATAYVWSRPISVATSREVHPPRVHAGTSSRVELEIRNTARRRSPVVRVRDPFARGWRRARFLVAPLGPGTSSQAAYRLPTEERGIYDIGPLEVTLSDPFGLAATSFDGAPVTQLTVYPRVDAVHPPPHSQGYDPRSGRDHPNSLMGSGDDFYALRAYEVGDDTRRVHWPSTARTGELMIRQDEMPWQTRATILLDVRGSVHSAASLERAVSAAASIHDACRRRGALVRLVTTDGVDSSFAEGHAHAEAILEHLATVDLTGNDRLAGAAASLHRAGNGGALAVVTTSEASGADLEVVLGLRSRYGSLVLVVFDTGAPGGPPGGGPGGLVVRVGPGQDFAAAWDRVVAPTATPAGGTR